MTPPPAIGITTYLEEASFACWKLPATVLPAAYAEAVVAAGGLPLLIPPLGEVTAALAAVDALVLSGGADLTPGLYGVEPVDATTGTRPERDAAELALLEAALEAKMPVLGVCRGMQLLNVACGGSLDQHLPDHLGHEDHMPEPGRFGTHPVTVSPESRLRRLLGPCPTVSSHHHQGVATVGEGLEIAALAADGTVEALELPGRALVIGVQWHPEVSGGEPLFAALVEAAAAARGRERVAA